MIDVRGDFDMTALFDAVELQRLDRGITWSALAKELAWMSPATIQRMRESGTSTCHHVLPLIQWTGRTPESFTVGGDDVAGELLPDPAPGTWRWYWDMPALAAALDAQRVERNLTWADVAGELRSSTGEIKQLQKTRYGTTISFAMRSARWLDRTATSFLWENDGRGLPWSGRRV